MNRPTATGGETIAQVPEDRRANGAGDKPAPVCVAYHFSHGLSHNSS